MAELGALAGPLGAVAEREAVQVELVGALAELADVPEEPGVALSGPVVPARELEVPDEPAAEPAPGSEVPAALAVELVREEELLGARVVLPAPPLAGYLAAARLAPVGYSASGSAALRGSAVAPLAVQRLVPVRIAPSE